MTTILINNSFNKILKYNQNEQLKVYKNVLNYFSCGDCVVISDFLFEL